MSPPSDAVLEQGKAAWAVLKKGSEDFERWIAVGRSLVLLRDDAEKRSDSRIGATFRKIMGSLLAQHGFDEIDKGVRSRLVAIIDNYDKVHAWRETLTGDQRLRWGHPNTISRRCPVFRKPSDKPTRASPLAVMQDNLALAKSHLAEAVERARAAEERAKGGNIDFENDTIPDIARMLADGLWEPTKVRQLISALLKEAQRLEKGKPARPRKQEEAIT
jgi:hypothetical protein